MLHARARPAAQARPVGAGEHFRGAPRPVKAHARVADAEERPQLPTSRRAALAAGVILPGLAGLATFPAIAAAVTTTTPTSTNTPLVDAAVAAGLPAQVDTIKLKGVGTVTALGIGAWSWGDRTGFWGWQSSYGKDDVYGAYRAAMDAGISLIDTAEAYGFGLSEQLINEFGARDGGRRPVIATKFAPLPWRSGRADVVKAARGSCARLGASRVGLYQCHWPGALPGQTEAYVDGLGDVLDAGLAAGVGVSNFKASRVEAAAAALGGRVSTNQVQYSLLYRTPEDNGVVSATQGAGATIIAYSPLAQGLLTGKYEDGGPLPTGPRAATITASRVKAVAPLIAAMRAVGAGHAVGGVAKTPAQVALNWCMAKGTLPIPGVKSARQATEASGALGWRMSRAEVEELDAVSSKIAPGLAFPTEKW